jgi:hypothetical protein
MGVVERAAKFGLAPAIKLVTDRFRNEFAAIFLSTVDLAYKLAKVTVIRSTPAISYSWYDHTVRHEWTRVDLYERRSEKNT